VRRTGPTTLELKAIGFMRAHYINWHNVERDGQTREENQIKPLTIPGVIKKNSGDTAVVNEWVYT
jgi:hypothetical protein